MHQNVKLNTKNEMSLSKYEECLLSRVIMASNDKKYQVMGSGGGSVGRAVASDTRGPRFESSHWQTFIKRWFIFLSSVLKRQK